MTWLIDFMGGRWLKAGFALAALAALGWMLWTVYDGIRDIGAAEVRAELQPKIDTLTTERDNAKAQLAEAKADRQKAEDASNAYQAELASLRDAPMRRDPVRLCIDPARPTARAPAAPATARLDGAATAAGMVPGGTRADLVPGPDIGPELRALLRRADQVTAQARGLQAYCADEAQP